MDDNPELALKKLCCTCLSRDRKLFQLCRIPEGVNNLYLLLSYDSEAYREGFYKDTASLHVCWECRAVMCRIMRFRQQACVAQRQLTSIVDGRSQIQTTCLSRLTTNHKTTFQKIISNSKNTELDNFIDCGLTMDIKSESEEDIPLSELNTNCASDSETQVVIQTIDYKEELSKDATDDEDVIFKLKKKKKLKNGRKRKYFSTVVVVDSELEDIRLQSKMLDDFVNAEFKCDSCIEIFSNQIGLDEHNSSLHREKPDHLQCDICLVYTPITLYQEHRESHYHRHTCQLCVYTSFNINDMARHLKTEHSIDNVDLTNNKRKKGRHKTDLSKKESKVKRNPTMTDKRTPYGYLCTECNKYFDNKNQRWKHVQRHHREGYKCETCGKRFAFKNNLTRHELLHRGGPPRQQCEVCHKQVRVDLLKVHARTHTDRQTHTCVHCAKTFVTYEFWLHRGGPPRQQCEVCHKQVRVDLLKVHARTHTDRQTHTCVHCAKTFVSRASYEHHLKYTKAHALVDILKYKCTLCDKGYRSRGELRDHVNYQHMGKTQHKCPVCGKALATRRCITRHVRRAHEGVKESARDKICQQCGKAFRDKKGLREHELIHTGQRPLSCEICGCTFRQSASLYTHRKRVHNVCSGAKTVTLQE